MEPSGRVRDESGMARRNTLLDGVCVLKEGSVAKILEVLCRVCTHGGQRQKWFLRGEATQSSVARMNTTALALRRTRALTKYLLANSHNCSHDSGLFYPEP